MLLWPCGTRPIASSARPKSPCAPSLTSSGPSQFPHAVQVLQLTRVVTNRKTGNRHTETVYAVTSLAATDAHPGQVADWLRGHWHIENRLHWVRDVTFHEDLSQIRTRGGPQVMATLRNATISLLRLAGHSNIAAALRYHARDHQRPIKLLLAS